MLRLDGYLVLLVLAFLFIVLGVLLIGTSRNPGRNGVTKTLFGIVTFLRIPGLLAPRTLVLLNGICFILGGLFVLITGLHDLWVR